MRTILLFVAFSLAFMGCKKGSAPGCLPLSCDMTKVYADNAAKVTISNGIWGTVASMEGNCMPGPDANKTCKTCPVQRTIRIYDFTTKTQAIPQGFNVFYDSFSTNLVKEVATDANGFYEAGLPPGKYTIAILENGKLYAPSFEMPDGISPYLVTGGKQNINLTMIYKAVF